MPRIVLEIALIDVGPRCRDRFPCRVRRGAHACGFEPGCRSVRMTQGVETRTRFVLLVEWDSVQAHDGFRSTSASASGAVWSAPTSPTRRWLSTSPT